MLDEEDVDWLHSNFAAIAHVRSVKEMQNGSTSGHLHVQESFIQTCASSEKKRQRHSAEQKRLRERERYSSMTDGQKDMWLHKNREYKKLAREHKTPFVTSHCTPVIQTQPYNNGRTGIIPFVVQISLLMSWTLLYISTRISFRTVEPYTSNISNTYMSLLGKPIIIISKL